MMVVVGQGPSCVVSGKLKFRLVKSKVGEVRESRKVRKEMYEKEEE
jgi:hypothetical protein